MQLSTEAIKKIAFHRFFWPVVLIVVLTLLYLFNTEFRTMMDGILMGFLGLGVLCAVSWYANKREYARSSAPKSTRRGRPPESLLSSVVRTVFYLLVVVMTGGLALFFLAVKPMKKRKRDRDW